jgi:hypothetical protein
MLEILDVVRMLLDMAVLEQRLELQPRRPEQLAGLISKPMASVLQY